MNEPSKPHLKIVLLGSQQMKAATGACLSLDQGFSRRYHEEFPKAVLDSPDAAQDRHHD